MFGRNKDNSSSTISDYIDKKSRQLKKKNKIIRSKIDHALHGEHTHYFSKQEVATLSDNARCKVCKMLLSEYRVQKKMENWSPHLKPIHNSAEREEEQF